MRLGVETSYDDVAACGDGGRVLDVFPQTTHLETAVVLERRSRAVIRDEAPG